MGKTIKETFQGGLTSFRDWHYKQFGDSLTANVKTKEKERDKRQYICRLNTSIGNRPFFGTGSREELALARAIDKAYTTYQGGGNLSSERRVRHSPLYTRR